MEYDPEFCSATCVAMENFHPLNQTGSDIVLLLRTTREGSEMLAHRPVSDGFGHEVVLSDVLGEGNQSARLVQHVLPHQT